MGNLRVCEETLIVLRGVGKETEPPQLKPGAIIPVIREISIASWNFIHPAEKTDSSYPGRAFGL
jgi:hypothetical protein